MQVLNLINNIPIKETLLKVGVSDGDNQLRKEINIDLALIRK